MAEAKNTTAKRFADAAADVPTPDAGSPEAKGFYGVEVDETPNENYTVAGVLAGLPTPENGK